MKFLFLILLFCSSAFGQTTYLSGVATGAASGKLWASGGLNTPPSWTSTPTLGIAGTTTGQLKFANATGANVITIAAPASPSAYTLTLPATGGTNNYALTTDGSGATSWSAVMSNPLTTTGDIIYSSSGTTAARLAIGSSSQILSVSGGIPAWITLIGGGIKAYSNTSITGNTVANTVTETAFTSTYTIPAGTTTAGDVLVLDLAGIYSTFVTPPNITVKVKIGGTTVLNSGAITSVGSITNLGWSARASLSFFTIGASGTCDAQATGSFTTNATTGTSLSVNVANSGTTVINTTNSNAITVTIEWSSANASNTITCNQFNVNWLRAQGTGTPVAVTNGGTGQTTVTTGDILYASATDAISKLAVGAAGSSLTVFGGVPVWTDARAYLSSDFITTSASLVDVTGLSFPIGANETWVVDLYLCGSASATSNTNLACNAPTGATINGAGVKLTASTAAGYAALTVETVWQPSALTVSTVTSNQAHFTVFNSSTAGTVQIRVLAATGGNNAYVAKGSYLRAYRVN